MNLIEKVKSVRKPKVQWYEATMISKNGTPYRVQVRATNEEEAINAVLENSPKENILLDYKVKLVG